MKQRKCLAPACIALLVLIAQAAPAQVLKQVPSDALMVIKVKNLKSVSDKIAALAQKFGLAGFNPAMSDPLTAVQGMTNMNNAVKTDGDMAMFIPMMAEGQNPEPIILIPVTDYKAFLANFADAQTEGEISSFKIPQDNDTTYCAQWGDYAAITPSKGKDALAKKPEGLTIDGAAAKEADAKDIIMIGNMKSIKTMVLPKLTEGRAQILAQFDQGFARAPQANQKLGPVFKAAINQLLNVAEGALETTNAATLGIDLSEAGIKATILADFAPDSYVAQRLKEMKNTSAPSLAGLPEGKYMLFGSAAGDPEVTLKIVNDFSIPIEKELAAIGDDGKPLQNYLDALKDYTKSYTAMQFGLVVPGNPGQEALFQMVGINTGNAKQIIDAQKKMFDAQKDIQQFFSQGAIQQTTSYTPNAKTVEGITLNEFSAKMSGDANTPQGAQVEKMMTLMYGPNGMTGYIGALDDNKIVMITGGSDELIKNAITAAKANEDKLSGIEQVKAVSAQLPAQRTAVAFIAVDQMIATGVAYAQQMQMPINMQLPADLPPIGVATSREGNAVRADAYIPAELVQSIVAAGMQAFMQMQGNQRPGGPGGL